MALNHAHESLRALSLVALFTTACSASHPTRTEVMVVVDSNLRVPSELDAVEIEASSPKGTKRRAKSSLQKTADLPGTVGLLHPGGALGTFHVVVRGKLGDALVLTREADFSFVQGQTLTLSMNLLRSCVDVTCPADETCGEQGCISQKVPKAELSPWNGGGRALPDASMMMAEAGMQPLPDGGMLLKDGGKLPVDGPDGSLSPGKDDAQVDPSCVPASETCNELDDDCDGKIDEDFNLQNDADNCGKCGTVCMLDNAESTCSASKCEISLCTSGFADCDKNATTGCEADLASDATCGGCNTKCVGQKHCCNDVCQVGCP